MIFVQNLMKEVAQLTVQKYPGLVSVEASPFEVLELGTWVVSFPATDPKPEDWTREGLAVHLELRKEFLLGKTGPNTREEKDAHVCIFSFIYTLII